jgi:hypothetical protein
VLSLVYRLVRGLLVVLVRSDLSKDAELLVLRGSETTLIAVRMVNLTERSVSATNTSAECNGR